jgi:pimeloyl-ACP methyl ester carboxylesterase
MKRQTIAVVSVLGILVGGVGLAEAAHAALGSRSPHASAPATPTSSADTIRWGPCTSATMLAEMRKKTTAVCGLLSVPLDYSHPGGAQIKLAVSMVRHTSPAASYQGAILVNPGGPGQPGLLMSGTGSYVPDGVGADYDWIGFDPRGVGASVPSLSCEPSYFDGPRMPYVPTSAAATKKWLDRAAAYATACARNGGALLDHVTTVDSAKDMDSIRKALGQRQISYYGYSYGTYLGQVYATLYPTHLHRLVLDSNVDPRTVWYQANLGQDPAFEANMNSWFAWLARHDDTYHLGRTGGAVRRLFFATQSSLDARPATFAVGGDEWNDVFMDAAYSQRTWANLGAAFAEWVHSYDAFPILGYYRDEAANMDAYYPGYVDVVCTDAPWPKSVAKNLADSRRIFAKAPYVTWQNQWFNAPCLTWPGAPHNPVKIDGGKVADALLIDQTLDAATPYEGSLEVRALFPNAALLALPGGTSHADSLSGYACEDDLIARYLGSGTLPTRRPGTAADATCPAPPLPVP